MAKTVPAPELPPVFAVPYRVVPDKINPANGAAPSLPVKLCRVVKVCAATRSDSIKRPRPAINEGRRNGFLMPVFIWLLYERRPPQSALPGTNGDDGRK